MAIYYIDSLVGNNDNDGLSVDRPLMSLNTLMLKANDTVLFRKGTVYRSPLDIQGFDDGVITLSSYGDGEMPTFYGSKNFSVDYYWDKTDNDNIWKLKIPLPGRVISLVYDFCMSLGEAAIDKLNMDFPGQWCCEYDENNGVSSLYIYSRVNPCQSFRDIEVIYKDSYSLKLGKNIVLKDVCISCSDNGIILDGSSNIEINDCRIEYCGGFLIDNKMIKRTGCGINASNITNDLKITDCVIYDSAVSEISIYNAKDSYISITGNTFDGYGFSSICLDTLNNVSLMFELNHCKGAEPAYYDSGVLLCERDYSFDLNLLNKSYHVFVANGNCKDSSGSKITIRRNIFTGKITGSDVENTAQNRNSFQIIAENNENY